MLPYANPLRGTRAQPWRMTSWYMSASTAVLRPRSGPFHNPNQHPCPLSSPWRVTAWYMSASTALMRPGSGLVCSNMAAMRARTRACASSGKRGSTCTTGH